MKKSNVIIFAILFAISVFLLWLWYRLGFNNVDNPLDLALSISWWIGIVVFIVVITKIEQKRRERVRTCYVANNTIYNSEVGTVELAPGADPASVMQSILENLEYGFEIKEMPSKQSVDFIYVVRSAKFKKGEAQQSADGQPAQAPSEPEWQGNVSVVLRPDDEPMQFDNREQLKAILAGQYVAPTPPAVPLQTAAATA